MCRMAVVGRASFLGGEVRGQARLEMMVAAVGCCSCWLYDVAEL